MAFSGGVDSTLLCYAAREAVGKENVLVLRGISEFVSQVERDNAEKVLDSLGVAEDLRVVVGLQPFLWPEVISNTSDRCYLCKKRMYALFLAELQTRSNTQLFDGTNVNDLQEKRPGLLAIRELSVNTPLLDAGLGKEDIRGLARQFGLITHDKPSNSCLATRLPHDTAITREELRRVEDCEAFLLGRNFSGCRVRPRKTDAILEVSEKDMQRLLLSSGRVEIIEFFLSSGFARVLIDLQGRS